MRTFKHKKTNDIAVQYMADENKYMVPDGTLIHKCYIEDSNDWEEILQESTCEIYSFRSVQNKNHILTLKGNRYFNEVSGISFNLKDMITGFKSIIDGSFEIYQVKRIDDGKIFTIGDIAHFGLAGPNFIINNFIVRKDGRILTRGRGGDPVEFIDSNLHINTTKHFEIISSADGRINSIIRLSDGEIFSVRDKTTRGTILMIKKDDSPKELERENMIWFTMEPGTSDSQFSEYNPLHLEKLKPLLKTVDGYDLYEGDPFFAITDNFEIVRTDRATEEEKKYANRIFHKKASAEIYITSNKPVLSHKEICDIFDKSGCNFTTDLTTATLKKINHGK